MKATKEENEKLNKEIGLAMGEWTDKRAAEMFDKDIEEELDNFDFTESDLHTREGMREVLTKQKYCDHKLHALYLSQGDVQTGYRCELCGYQIFN